MVKFYDPLEKKEITYYISPMLLKNWDKLKDGKLKKKDDTWYQKLWSKRKQPIK